MALLGLLCALPSASGQSIIAPPSANFETQASSHTLTPQSVPPVLNASNAEPGIYQWGLVDLHPHFLYRLTYGDGIPSTPTNRVKTAIQEFSPGMLIRIGDQWTLDYTPTYRLYSSSRFPNYLDELVTLNGRTAYNDWVMTLSQTYSSSDSPLLETEALTQQENFLTALSASRVLGSQFSTQFGATQNFRSSTVENFSQNIKEWSGFVSLNDQIWSSFGASITGTGGYDLVSPGASMTFEQAQGAATWTPGEKFTMTAGAGIEVRQLLGSELINPIFNAAATYKPWEHTAASLRASRTVAPSFFNDDVIVATSISADVSQRFLQRFTLDVSGGYSSTPFVGFARVSEFLNFHEQTQINPTTTVQQSRADTSRFATIRLSTAVRKRGTVSVFYSYLTTSSGLSAYNFSSTQVGLELGWRY